MKIAFISARKDESSCKMLLQEFRKRQSFEVQIAHTDEQEWPREVRQFLDKADYVFLLVSPAYFLTTPEKFPQINQIVHRSKFSSASQKVIALLISPSDWRESIIAECREILPEEGLTITDDRGNPIISTCEMIARTIFGPPHKKPFEAYWDYLKRSSTLIPKHLLQFNFATLLSKLQKFPRSIYLSSRNYVALYAAAILFIIMLYFIFAPLFCTDSIKKDVEPPPPTPNTNIIVPPPPDTDSPPPPPIIVKLKDETPVPFFVCLDGEVRTGDRMIIKKPSKSAVEQILSEYRKYSGNIEFKINIDTEGNVSADIKDIKISPEMPNDDLESFKNELTNKVIQEIEFVGRSGGAHRRSNTGSIKFYFNNKNKKPEGCKYKIEFK